MKLNHAVVGLVALGSAALMSGGASAMPNGLATTGLASAVASPQVDQVRWVCGPYRCFWRPNFYGAYGYVGPRWGWHHRWHRGWHRW